MRSVRSFALLLAVAGCYDFVEPDFPEAGAPAVLQATAFRDIAGNISITAQLVPGLAIGGIQREIPNDTLEIYGLRLTPKEIKKNGTRIYGFEGPALVAATFPFVLAAPGVAGVIGPPPRAQWFPVRKTDGDTIVWKRGSELVLHVDTALGVSTPTPPIRQWFLELRGADRSFRVSSDGPPPLTLRIPPEWVPAVNTQTFPVFLSYFQSGQQQSPNRDYIGIISFNTQMRWTIRIDP